MFSSSGFNWPARFKAAGIHFGISLISAFAAALLVFLVWYPYPYREISGGRELFILIVLVDVVMGPLMTLAVFNLKKPLKELRRDLAVIVVLQLAALAYGLWTVSVARPVHLVFEIDRFRVVHAVDIPVDMLQQAPAEFQRLPLTGVTLLSIRDFASSKESFDATMAALQGAPLGARPDLWQSYEKARLQIVARAKPVAELKARFPNSASAIDEALKKVAPDRATESVSYVPMVGRDKFWTVLIDSNSTEVIAFVPLDSF